MKNKYIPVRKLRDTGTVTVTYPEIVDFPSKVFLEIFVENPGDYNDEIESKRKEAIFYLEKSIRAGERMKTIFNSGDNVLKQTP